MTFTHLETLNREQRRAAEHGVGKKNGATCPPSVAERHCSIADMTWS